MINGIIFDLGNTLIRMSQPWDDVGQKGTKAMAEWYKKKQVKLNTDALIDTFLANRATNYKQALETGQDLKAEETLRNTLKEIKAPARAEALVTAAIKIFFGPEEAASHAYPDAVATVKALKVQGYKLGLLSNASDDALIRRLVNNNGFSPWLSPVFSSVGVGWRKPMPQAFAKIIQRWGLPPAEIVMVGDTLNADILGAQNSGMSNILVTMNQAPSNADNQQIKPSATASSLAELPDIIKQL